MFVDASVIVAVINQEDDAPELLGRLEEADVVHISPLVRYESMLAVAKAISERRKSLRTPSILSDALALVDELILEVGAIEIVVTPEIGAGAIDASMRYGNVIRHPAALNFGDCFAYACAKALKAKLIYKGNDFVLTDLA